MDAQYYSHTMIRTSSEVMERLRVDKEEKAIAKEEAGDTRLPGKWASGGNKLGK